MKKNIKIPFFKTNYDKKELMAFTRLVKSGNFSMGEKTKELEEAISKKLNINKDQVALVSSCTTALHLAMLVCGINKNDEVICPSLSFVADANCIKYVNAIPKFVDINSKDNWNISPNNLEKKISKKTKAIIMFHYAGYPCDIVKIKKIAKKYKLFLIEDACHSTFSKYKNKFLGTFGDIGVYSLYGNKNITTGEGGIIIGDRNYINKIKILRNHAITLSMVERKKIKTPDYNIKELGFNYRFDDIRSALGLEQLKKINQLNLKRKTIALNYKFLINKYLPEVIIPFTEYIGLNLSYHLFPILLPKFINRKKLIEYLHKNKIQTSIHYRPIHKTEYYYDKKNKLPVVENIYRNILSLPIYPKLKFFEQEIIIKKINNFIQKVC